jgi:hypothetical protein
MLRYIISAKIVIGQYEEYRKKFAAFDLDDDGHLDQDEAANFLQAEVRLTRIMCVCAYTHIDTSKKIDTYIDTHIHIQTRTHTNKNTHTHTHTHTHTQTHTHTHTHAHTRTDSHTHTHSSP